MKQQDIIIVGGGLVGSLLALLMGQRGHRVRVFERRPDMRRADISAGKSINLAMSDRGWRALEMAGLKETIAKIAMPMYGRKMHDLEGNLTFLPYHEDGRCIYSVSRRDLNITMMNESEAHERVELFFDKRVDRVDFDARTVHFDDGDSATGDVILGTDGAFSAVRLAMLLSPMRLSYSQDYLRAGYIELQLPANPGFPPDTWDREAFQIDNDCLHIWPRGDFMLIALPDPGGTFTMTLFLDHEPADESAEAFSKLTNADEVNAFFGAYFPDVVPLMPKLAEDFFDGPVGALVTVKTSPWHYDDKACLLGDAAHAVVPFYGQGMNCGFEDCRVFAELVDADTTDDWGSIFEQYNELREDNGKAIADLAIYNYWEMRDRVADPAFLLRKKIEAKISKMYGDAYTPLYSMVTFSHIPYADAKELGEEHEEMMLDLMRSPGFLENWDTPEGEAMIEEAMSDRGIDRPERGRAS